MMKRIYYFYLLSILSVLLFNGCIPDVPIIAIEADKEGCIGPCDITFTAKMTGKVKSYKWIYADSSRNEYKILAENQEKITHSFPLERAYTIHLEAENKSGKSIASKQISILNANYALPIADFELVGGNCWLGSPTQFRNLSTGTELSYQWNLGDGQTSTMADVSHTYINAVDFLVSLIVKDKYGATSTVSKTITVNKGARLHSLTLDQSPSNWFSFDANESGTATAPDVVMYLKESANILNASVLKMNVSDFPIVFSPITPQLLVHKKSYWLILTDFDAVGSGQEEQMCAFEFVPENYKAQATNQMINGTQMLAVDVPFTANGISGRYKLVFE
ncbi:MAG: PKD domain-containing protein [Bacteroidia bacterium]